MRESMVRRCALVPAASAHSSSSISDIVMAGGCRWGDTPPPCSHNGEETIAPGLGAGGRVAARPPGETIDEARPSCVGAGGRAGGAYGAIMIKRSVPGRGGP